MIKYNVQLNQGNEALGSGVTITANEAVETCDTVALAREIHHLNPLIPDQVAASVFENFGRAAAELMSMGFAIQFKAGEDVILRIYPDIHVKGGNINLERAQQLKPGTTELTAENAGELVTLAGGVTIRAKAEVEQKFTELLLAQNPHMERKDLVLKAFVPRSGNAADPEEPETPSGGGSNAGGDNNGGGVTPPGGNTGNDD